MAATVIGLNDAKAVKRWSATLMVDVGRESYFTRKFMGEGEKAPVPIQRLTNLEKDSGEEIRYDLSLQLKQEPVEGDDTLEGKEEDLKWAQDIVYIDQMRQGVNAGGRMTRKRTLHDLRMVSRARLSEWWARAFDELFFMYLSGARGINTDYIFSTSYTGRAYNSFNAPDSDHIIYGDGTSKATLTASGTMTTAVIERAKTKASTIGGGTDEIPEIQPIRVEGEEHFVTVMHPFAEHDLRTGTGTSNWLEIQKSAASAEGRNNPIFKGSLGMHNGVILHSHKAGILFSDYGAGGNVDATRALFLGRQAAVVAFGSPGSGLRFDWHEETEDRGNKIVIDTACIVGMKKCRFNSKDFGLLSLDVAASDPN